MTTFKNQINQADFEALVMSELEDMELSLEQLEIISGGGWLRDKIKQAADWVESKLGDGDGEHEVTDYIDEVIAVVSWFMGKSKE
ncbi:hypothetical protein [Prochlorococcus sp. MIT 0701]|uniref:hypothetical protein n=1 Tax=Prochlorococcus sp. MIT 0701 TaxID=1499502 RepID=UPI0039AFBAA2